MSGIRVVEVAAWTYVPVAGSILAEWGADVLKVEHPELGDPMRGLVSSGLVPADGVAHMFEMSNAGKRSVALDLKSPEGHELLMKMVETADVFLTNMRPSARKKLGIDVEHIQARNPKAIYVRGSASGQKGPESERGGYDLTSFWARSGIADNVSPDILGFPVTMPGPAYGDVTGGLALAGAISTALFHRERTGEAVVVDGSLLATGAWAMGGTIAGAYAYNQVSYPKHTPDRAPNPLVNSYGTADGRFLTFVMLESDRFWPEFVRTIGAPELADDERFNTHAKRTQNNVEACAALADAIKKKTLAEWEEILKDFDGAWAKVQHPIEVVSDPQVVANDYIADLKDWKGTPFKLVSVPVQFNEEPGDVSRAPQHGEHTDEVMQEVGYSMEEIIELKISGAIL